MSAVDVVVLSKDRPDLFTAAAASVDRQHVDYTGILIDNGSDGFTRSIAHEHGWLVVDAGHNTSFSEGCNLGVSHGDSPTILLLNNDAVLHDGALAALLAHADEGFGVVGSLITMSDGRVNHAGGQLMKGMPWHIGRGSRPGEWSCFPCDWVTFAAVLIRRDCFEQVGPMDEGYWYSFEDVDYCRRVTEAGWPVGVCADARVTHDECGTRDRSKDDANRARYACRWLQQEAAKQ